MNFICGAPGILRLLCENPLLFVFVAVALIISLSIHEFAHAWVGEKLGDPTARYLGRVTLNPMAHLDPVGTLLLLLAGFGWGRPVPYNPMNLENPKRDAALIGLAGPVSNFLLAAILIGVYKLIGGVGIWGPFLFFTILYNVVLGTFNLIPVHPLDGFKVVNGLLPQELSVQWMQLAPYGLYFLIFLVFTNTTDLILRPIIGLLFSLLGVSF